MNKMFTVATTTFVLAAFPLLAEIDVTKLPPAAKQQDLSYEKDIKPVLEASCFRCHGEKEQKGRLRLDSLEAVLKGSKEGKVVEAGNAVKSQLLISVSQLDPESAMPPKPRTRRNGPGGERRESGTNSPATDAPQRRGPEGDWAPGGPNGFGGPGGPGKGFTPAKPLTAEQVGLIRAWIDQGAK